MNRVYFGKGKSEIPIVCYSGEDRDLEPGIICGPIIRDVYIIECNTSGYGSVVINGREFPVAPGDCYILLPEDTIIHTASMENPRSGFWCAADGRQMGIAIKNAGITSENPFAPPELFEELTEEIRKITLMRNDTDPGAELRRTGHLYNFLGILMKNNRSVTSDNWLAHAIGYMETHYDEDITVTDIARVAHLERSYFSVRFKAETGITPSAYLASLRVRKACEIMRKTDFSVSEIAETVGLDPRNFSRIFRKETGMTPKEFLKGKK
ncbi:MAG: AraC family transcriptional regulator [Oscillospiraceae bacterium]|nr:AraC family transcriptional regulator [Oscillospiraceae bacterium]